jgi:hypothetical protein
MLKREYYSDEIKAFLKKPSNEILGVLTSNNEFNLELTQKEAWKAQIEILKNTLSIFNEGYIYFEFSIPRMGRRIDVVLLLKNIIFIIEFKVGGTDFPLNAIDQVWDYALDLKNFHETSHHHLIAPILVATSAPDMPILVCLTPQNDNLLFPIKTNDNLLRDVITKILEFDDNEHIDVNIWSKGKYSPTPTIIEAAMALYNNHSVAEISRSDASAINLSQTSTAISDIIHDNKLNKTKSICFVTGVPGAGKTLVGLDIATRNMNKDEGLTSVFLSGNGPLVAILREALTRDKLKRERERGNKLKKKEVESNVKVFIQNVHHFRDECLIDQANPPFDHVAIFDEAQRAWNHEQTAKFMKQKKNFPDFLHSEPEFLISCLDRHKDWAVIVCLVGGGQEINTGEAGISEWINSINRSFPNWNIHISPQLNDSEYDEGMVIEKLKEHKNIYLNPNLHLAVSMRSFRAEHLSYLIKMLLDHNTDEAKKLFKLLNHKYPIVITRNLSKAKKWLKQQARGTERFGIVVSSQAQRLKPYAIDVKSPMDPVHWFLDGKEDTRSSYYLEDVATEFHVQGLELDWACVTWDADFRYKPGKWEHFSFVGSKWHKILKEERKQYLKNAYRVLLTRARQGMVIVIPEGELLDHTRLPEYYDSTYNYLVDIGLTQI